MEKFFTRFFEIHAKCLGDLSRPKRATLLVQQIEDGLAVRR
jgi:hypothetical protein